MTSSYDITMDNTRSGVPVVLSLYRNTRISTTSQVEVCLTHLSLLENLPVQKLRQGDISFCLFRLQVTLVCLLYLSLRPTYLFPRFTSNITDRLP